MTEITIEEIQNNIISSIKCINSMNPDLTAANLSGETYLGGDIGMQSIDLIRLVSEIQQIYNSVFIPFQEMFINEEGEIITDITIKDITLFIFSKLKN